MKYSVDDDFDAEFITDILGIGMVIEWITPKINSLNNTQQVFGSSEEKFYSQTNHLNGLKDLKKSHKEMFWLLLYKDPKTKDEFKNVDFEKYFINLMKKIDGLNTLLFYPVEIVAIMSLLQAALNETRSDDFNYRSYRKLILDAHSLVDKINSRS